jgi:hypothetical protein
MKIGVADNGQPLVSTQNATTLGKDAVAFCVLEILLSLPISIYLIVSLQ